MARIAKPVQKGAVIDYINTKSATVEAGEIVQLGKFCGVAETDIPQNEAGVVAITKVWDVPAVSGTAFNVGDILYWSGTQATKTAGSNAALGVCVAPKTSGQTVARVKIGVVFPAGD